MPKLIVKGSTFFSPRDEEAFFVWLMAIGCVKGVTGHLRELHIALKRAPSAKDARELEALFRRYRMSEKGLAKIKPASPGKRKAST